MQQTQKNVEKFHLEVPSCHFIILKRKDLSQGRVKLVACKAFCMSGQIFWCKDVEINRFLPSSSCPFIPKVAAACRHVCQI